MNRSRCQFAVDAGGLTVGTIVGGFAAYGFILIGTRTLGADQFAPVSILWTFWAASASFVTFPLQHWAIRTIEAQGSDDQVRASIPMIAIVATVLSVVVAAVAILGRESLFGQESFTYPILAAAIPYGSAAMGLLRGSLAGRGRFGLAAAVIAGENLVRLTCAAFVVVLGGGAVGFGLALIAGFAVALVHPPALKPSRHDEGPNVVSPLAFISGIALGSIVGQVVLTGGPVVLAVMGGSAAQVTALFSALALFRAPYMVATGVAVRLTGALTGLVVQGQDARMRRARVAAALVILVVALGAGVFGYVLGDDVLRLIFGPGVTLDDRALAMLAAGSVFALGTLYFTLSLVAKARTTSVTVAWLIAIALSAGWLVGVTSAPVQRVAEAFLLAEVGALTVLWWADRGTVGAGSVSYRQRPPRS